jgi:hypothetical protein
MDLAQSINSLSRVGSQQQEKMRQIDQEVRFIRQKLQEKTQNQEEPRREPQRTRSNLSEERPQGYFGNAREPIQQNINCINIYNHNSPLTPAALAALPQFMPAPPRQDPILDP